VSHTFTPRNPAGHGRMPAAPPPAAAPNPLEQLVRKIKKAVDDKRAEVDKAVAEFTNKNKKAAKSSSYASDVKTKNAAPSAPSKHKQQPQEQNKKEKAAAEKEVKEYIAKSYARPKAKAAPAPAAKKAAAPAPAKKDAAAAPAKAAAAPAAAKMSKKGPQKVTAADLSDADKATIGAHPATFVGAAAVLVACYAASRVMRKPATGGGDGGIALGKRVADSADLDSAYASPSKVGLYKLNSADPGAWKRLVSVLDEPDLLVVSK
jgi:hypothetical protein